MRDEYVVECDDGDGGQDYYTFQYDQLKPHFTKAVKEAARFIQARP